MGDALCIGSAALFGVHKWRSETATAAHSASTIELIAVQLLVLAAASALLCAPEFLQQASQGPGVRRLPLNLSGFRVCTNPHSNINISLFRV